MNPAGSQPPPYGGGLVTLERISVMLLRKEEELRLQKEAEDMNETTFERKARMKEDENRQKAGQIQSQSFHPVAAPTSRLAMLGKLRGTDLSRENEEAGSTDAAEAQRLLDRGRAIGFLATSRRVAPQIERRPTSRAEAAVSNTLEALPTEYSPRRSRTTLGRRSNRHMRRGSVDSIVPTEKVERDDFLDCDAFSDPEPDLLPIDQPGHLINNSSQPFKIVEANLQEYPGVLPPPIYIQSDQNSAFAASLPRQVDPSLPMSATLSPPLRTGPLSFPARSSSRGRAFFPPKLDRAITVSGGAPSSPKLSSPLSPHIGPGRAATVNSISPFQHQQQQQQQQGMLPVAARPAEYFGKQPYVPQLEMQHPPRNQSRGRRVRDPEDASTSTGYGQSPVDGTYVQMPPMSPSSQFQPRPTMPYREDESIVHLDNGYPQQQPIPRQNNPISVATNGVRLDRSLGSSPSSPSYPSSPSFFAPASVSQRGAPTIPFPHPRRFVHQGRAWQVMTTSTVKDRYLFLFTDILVIAKQLKSETETAKPLFQVKSIMPLRHAQLVLKDERWQYSYRTPSSAIQAAIRKFSTNPIKAIAYLIAKRAFPCTPEAIAHFLHITSGLSRKQLGRFMGINEHADILQSFLSMFPLKGQRLDECLRLFLSTVRLPGEASTIDFVLDSFAKRWYHYNKDTVDFDANVTLKLVFTIMELNAEIHNPYADETNATTSREFVDRFRTGVRAEAVAAGSGIYSSGVSNELLENMYDSVRREKLEMADLDSDAGEKERVFVEVEMSYVRARVQLPEVTRTADAAAADAENEHALPPFPSRLTLKHTSPLIQVKISQPDPNFRIHMHGQDLVFDPPVLDFTRSNTATFTMRGTGLGRKLVFFTKRGAASSTRKYVTPQTRQVTIEPAFLRHSFQTTFHSHLDGVAGDNYVPYTGNLQDASLQADPLALPPTNKKKYLFAVSDSAAREQWIAAFKAAGISPNAPAPRRPSTSSPISSNYPTQSSSSSSAAQHYPPPRNTYYDQGRPLSPNTLATRQRTNSDSSSNSTSSTEEMETLQDQVAIRVLKDCVLPVDGPPLSAEGIVEAVLRNARIPLALGFMKSQGW